MLRPILAIVTLCLAMLLPYLPGRFDRSAATVSFLAQLVSYGSLLLVPVGAAWMVSRRRSRLWATLALSLAALTTVIVSFAAVADNQLALGVLVGTVAITLVWRAYGRVRSESEREIDGRARVARFLVLAPILLVTFRTTVLPAAAARSRSRAIRHSAPLVSAIESFRQRRGHYPVSLHSLNRDIPTGVVGIERFHYEPNGTSYNLFFVRQSIELDAREVVLFNPRDEHRFASHELDLLQYDGAQLDLRRGDSRRTALAEPHWVSILFD